MTVFTKDVLALAQKRSTLLTKAKSFIAEIPNGKSLGLSVMGMFFDSLDQVIRMSQDYQKKPESDDEIYMRDNLNDLSASIFITREFLKNDSNLKEKFKAFVDEELGFTEKYSQELGTKFDQRDLNSILESLETLAKTIDKMPREELLEYRSEANLDFLDILENISQESKSPEDRFFSVALDTDLEIKIDVFETNIYRLRSILTEENAAEALKIAAVFARKVHPKNIYHSISSIETLQEQVALRKKGDEVEAAEDIDEEKYYDFVLKLVENFPISNSYPNLGLESAQSEFFESQAFLDKAYNSEPLEKVRSIFLEAIKEYNPEQKIYLATEDDSFDLFQTFYLADILITNYQKNLGEIIAEALQDYEIEKDALQFAADIITTIRHEQKEND